ncbi:transcription factor 7-like 1-B isoform X2 [Festucalex cinctus]
MPQLSDDGDLGASDELIPFKDEGEGERDHKTAAARRDLDDVKSALVNESESNNSASDSEAADGRATSQADAEADADADGPAGHRQLLGEALRPSGGLFPLPAYMGYPFFMIPDLCGSYLAGGSLAAAAYLPWQWPLLDMAGRAARRDPPAHPLGDAYRSHDNLAAAHPAHLAHLAHLHTLLSYRPDAASPPRAGSSRAPHVARYPDPQVAQALDWLSSAGLRSASPSSSPAAAAAAVVVKQEPGEARQCDPLRKSAAAQAVVVGGGGDRKVKGHIKKPLNAFMLFMRDERPKVVAQCQVKESATINQILGQRWHSLSKDEQAKYYELARKERLLHSQLYPGWSARDNYGKKKKRKKSKSEIHPDAAAPPPKRTHLSRPHAVSHLSHTHLSQASPASSVDSPATPTAAALASPAAPVPTSTELAHCDQPLALTTKPVRGGVRALATPTSEPPSAYR